jgi:hypothetical protein
MYTSQGHNLRIRKLGKTHFVTLLSICIARGLSKGQKETHHARVSTLLSTISITGVPLPDFIYMTYIAGDVRAMV